MAYKLVCGDILQFQEQLNKMRSLDDKLIYALNMSLPTVSIKARTDSNPAENCKELYESLRASHTDRGKFIDDCILVTADQVKSLKTQLDSSDDTKLEKQFKSEQRKLRVLKTEQTVEEIVRERTLKSFTARCRTYYHADSL